MMISSMFLSFSSLRRPLYLPLPPSSSPSPFISPQNSPFFNTSIVLSLNPPQERVPSQELSRAGNNTKKPSKTRAQTLRFLKSVKSLPLQSSLDCGSSAGLSQLQWPNRDWEVLDAYLNADDMKLIRSAYKFPHYRGFLPNIGKFKNICNSVNMFVSGS